MKKSIIASLFGLAFTTAAYAEETVITTNDVTVKANRFEHKDTETTYASEIHTAKEIEDSGAATLYDFLAQQTSLNVSPSIGNRATPSINLRGFGTENGFQNVVITVNGQRLNNIDSAPALLAGIPVSNIERIEISKGSGSVIYGDGATAGAIQIYTKNKTGITISSSLGNFGQQNHYINAGISEQYIDLSAGLAHDGYDGFSKKDVTGHKDEFSSDTQNVKLRIKPTGALRFIAEGTSSRNDIRYVNPLSKSQFNDDPRQSRLSPYTHQAFDSDQWKIGTEFDVTKNVQFNAIHYQEDKYSDFQSAFPSTANYLYKSNEVNITYKDEIFNAILGYQDFDGERKSVRTFGISKDTSSKNNYAFFAQGEYRIEKLTLSAGIRDEKVKYKFSPLGGSINKSSNNIDAWDVGVNYHLDDEFSIFANYNIAYQAPDLDRLYDYFGGGGFNGFIDPAKSKTMNLGINHTIENNRLKISAFRSNLHDEIYLFQTGAPLFIFKNTNLDESHKYGLEIQDYFKFSNSLSTSIIYNYTRAIIDKEDDGAGAFNGKDLPGVPKHTVVANLNYKFSDHANLNLNHTWRSKAYAFNDLQNNFDQKQRPYESTNVALSYQFKNYQVFTSITNLFEHENSIQVADDFIYPVDFVRTWRVGVKADF